MEKKQEAETVIVEKMPTIYEAILNVMKDVKNIEKSMTVGTGNSSYKGVSDKDVKYIVGKAMEKHNLVILPIDIEPKLQVERWEEEVYDNYQKKNVVKQKQLVFTEVITTYKIIHTLSRESVEIKGYGHGVDSQDKSAGKATTYALKYALLYAFMVPTGDIEDADKTHSNEIATPPVQAQPKQKKECDSATFEVVKKAILDGKKTVEQAKEVFIFTGTQSIELLNLKK
jgi:hypothetical protein